MTRRALALLAASTVLLTLTGCAGPSARGDGPPRVVAGFYPLAFVAERIGGERVTVDTAIKPGAEPHDVELSPAEVAKVERADLVLLLAGFQPALDDAVEGKRDAVLDAAAVLDPAAAGHGEQGGEDDGHGHDDEAADPHFWLDPTVLARYADAVATRLSRLDDANAAAYATAATTLKNELEALDAEFENGLRDCARKELVTSHTAFGYLARRYGLTQLGIAGLSPEAEPSPRRIREVTAFVREHEVTTIYFETLVSPEVARTIAAETGARTAVLDPVEAITASGDDYFRVMRRNLAALRDGLGCR